MGPLFQYEFLDHSNCDFLHIEHPNGADLVVVRLGPRAGAGSRGPAGGRGKSRARGRARGGNLFSQNPYIAGVFAGRGPARGRRGRDFETSISRAFSRAIFSKSVYRGNFRGRSGKISVLS